MFAHSSVTGVFMRAYLDDRRTGTYRFSLFYLTIYLHLFVGS